MGWAWNAVGLWPLVVTLAAWSAATLIFLSRPDRPQNRWLGLTLVVEPFLFVWGSVFIVFTDSAASAYAWASAAQLAAAIWLYAYLRFVATFETPLAQPLRTRTGRLMSALLALGIGIGYWAIPGGGVERVTPSVVSTWSVTFGPLFNILTIPTFLIFLYSLVAAVSAWRRAPPGTASRDRARIFALAFGLRDLSVFFLLVWILVFSTTGPATTSGETTTWFLLPVPAVMFLTIASYGVLKHQFFDIDLKVKWTLRRGTLLGALAGIFFVVKEGIEALLPLEGVLPSILGAAAIGLLATPAWRFAGGMADRVLPGVEDTQEYRTVRKHEVYQAALEEALTDGALSEKDRNVLTVLAEQLGISSIDASRIEHKTGSNVQERS